MTRTRNRIERHVLMLGCKIVGQFDGAHRIVGAGDQSKALANLLIATMPLHTQPSERRGQKQDIQTRVLVLEQVLKGEAAVAAGDGVFGWVM